MSELLHYIDENQVSWFVPTSSIVAAVLNRAPDSFLWRATFTLLNGAKLVLVDHNDGALIRRVQNGDAVPPF